MKTYSQKQFHYQYGMKPNGLPYACTHYNYPDGEFARTEACAEVWGHGEEQVLLVWDEGECQNIPVPLVVVRRLLAMLDEGKP